MQSRKLLDSLPQIPPITLPQPRGSSKTHSTTNFIQSTRAILANCVTHAFCMYASNLSTPIKGLYSQHMWVYEPTAITKRQLAIVSRDHYFNGMLFRKRVANVIVDLFNMHILLQVQTWIKGQRRQPSTWRIIGCHAKGLYL